VLGNVKVNNKDKSNKDNSRDINSRVINLRYGSNPNDRMFNLGMASNARENHNSKSLKENLNEGKKKIDGRKKRSLKTLPSIYICRVERGIINVAFQFCQVIIIGASTAI